jgi:hypothetical protein
MTVERQEERKNRSRDAEFAEREFIAGNELGDSNE